MNLFADLPHVPRQIMRQAACASAAPIICHGCGSVDWFRCAPGTASTAELHPHSNVVAFRADDGVDLVAWCADCDPLVGRS